MVVNTGRRYRVGNNIAPAEYREALVNQSAVLEGLNPSDIEHTIQQPDASLLAPLLLQVGPVSHRLMLTDNDAGSPGNLTIGLAGG